MGGIWERQIRSACAILSSLGKSLDEESLLTLVAETKALLNSRSLNVETISNPTSDLSLAPSNILMKVVMHHQVILVDLNYTVTKDGIVPITSVTCKWQDGKRNFSVSEIVLVLQD